MPEPARSVADVFVAFPAVGIRMVRPDGFEQAEDFHGFRQGETASSVMASLIPGPFAEVRRGFDKERMARQGMTLLGSEEIEIDGIPGILLRVRQSAHGTQFLKWIAVFGAEEETRIVMATFPEAEEAALSSRLEAVARGVRLDSTPPPPPGSDLGFTLRPSDRLKPATQGYGKMLMYTSDGIIPTRSPGEPIFVAAPSTERAPIADVGKSAVELIHRIASVRITTLVESRPVTIDGLDGHEIVADAVDAKEGTPLVVYQVLLVDGDGHIQMLGLVGEDSREEYLPEFGAMARSFERKRK